MRMVRVLAGALLLVTGIPALLVGVALGADLTLDLRAELPSGWAAPVTAGLLAGGVLLVTSALALLLRPVRPREVVFVVEPDQVPVLAGRLGVTSLSGLGGPAEWDPAVPPARQLVSVGAPLDRPRPAIGPVPAGRPAPGPPGRPATLADLLGPPGGAPGGPAAPRCGGTPLRPSEVDLSLAWPPTVPPRTAPPTPVFRARPERSVRREAPIHRLRPAAPVDPSY